MTDSCNNDYDTLQKVLEHQTHLDEVKDRVISKLLKMSQSLGSNSLGFETDEQSIIDEDMFIVGRLEDDILRIDIPPVNITINLKSSLKRAIICKDINTIKLLASQKIDLNKLYPGIMFFLLHIQCIDIFLQLIEYRVSVEWNNYQCMVKLAQSGMLEIIQLILDKYNLNTNENLVGQICIEAIKHNHINVLSTYMTPKKFEQCPDITWIFFTKGIEYGASIEIINFFIKNGIDITKSNYLPVRIAIDANRCDIIEYFCKHNKSVLNYLTIDEKIKYGLNELINVDKYIGLNNSCCIHYDDIFDKDYYFQCMGNGIKNHFYKKDNWLDWVKSRSEWKCIHCQSSVEKVIYRNIIS